MRTDLTIADVLRQLRHEAGDLAPTYPMFHRRVVEGRIPAEKFGRGWMIRAEDLDRVRRVFDLPLRGRAA